MTTATVPTQFPDALGTDTLYETQHGDYIVRLTHPRWVSYLVWEVMPLDHVRGDDNPRHRWDAVIISGTHASRAGSKIKLNSGVGPVGAWSALGRALEDGMGILLTNWDYHMWVAEEKSTYEGSGSDVKTLLRLSTRTS